MPAVSLCGLARSLRASPYFGLSNVPADSRDSIMKIGATHRYVMEALLAFSAMHIAFLTDCPMVGNMAYVHRGSALKGLQEAINSFSRETSDAVLAASLVLSWQATDW